MTRRLIGTTGQIGLVVLTLGAHRVDAQTTPAGQYYPTPSWNQTLPANTRFVVLSNFDNNAVLDRETGLVWERSPKAPFLGSPTLPGDTGVVAWALAEARCNSLVVANRKGWRVPTFQELSTLVDPSVPFPGATLPPGHPFIGIQSASYWSSTLTFGKRSAWLVDFENGRFRFDDFVGPYGPLGSFFVWCVRGGHGVEGS